MALDPDIQKHFDFKYVEGELHMFVSKDLVKALGWTDKDIKLSFGNIERMNSFKGANLTIKADEAYEHPWMPPIRVVTPEKGKIVVFGGCDVHYVPPQGPNYERVVMSGNMQLNKEVHQQQ